MNKYTEEIKTIASTIKNSKVLDVGCSNGINSTRFFIKENTVVGLDVSFNGFYDKKHTFAFCVGDGIFLPFKDKMFDVVTSFDVIEHVQNDELFISEMLRVLKNQGLLILGTPNRMRLANRFQQVLRPGSVVYPRYYGDNPELSVEVTHLREYSVDDLNNLFHMPGVIQSKVYAVLLGLYFPIGFGRYIRLGIKKVPSFLTKFGHHLFIIAKKK